MEAAEAETVSKAQKDQELSRKRQLEKSAAELEDAKTALEQKGKDLAAKEAQQVELRYRPHPPLPEFVNCKTPPDEC